MIYEGIHNKWLQKPRKKILKFQNVKSDRQPDQPSCSWRGLSQQVSARLTSPLGARKHLKNYRRGKNRDLPHGIRAERQDNQKLQRAPAKGQNTDYSANYTVHKANKSSTHSSFHQVLYKIQSRIVILIWVSLGYINWIHSHK